MEDKSPILIILVLFILLGLAYGPFQVSKGAVTKRSNTDTSIVNETSSSLGTSPNKKVAEQIKDAEEEIKKLEKNLAEQTLASKRSPYYGKVVMSQISRVNTEDPSSEYISLSTYLEDNQTIKITDWYLKSEVTGYYAVIGKASLLPFPFTKTESNITLQQNDRVYLIKGFSPIGISFRTNACTGYFEENKNFTPSLPRECPRPINEDLPKFSSIPDRNDECIDILESIPRCTTKGNEFIRDQADTVTQSCKTYITTQINYNSCVAKHFSDTDFPGNEYRVYLNKFGSLWRDRNETINLYDQNGLVVDSISY